MRFQLQTYVKMFMILLKLFIKCLFFVLKLFYKDFKSAFRECARESINIIIVLYASRLYINFAEYLYSSFLKSTHEPLNEEL